MFQRVLKTGGDSRFDKLKKRVCFLVVQLHADDI